MLVVTVTICFLVTFFLMYLVVKLAKALLPGWLCIWCSEIASGITAHHLGAEVTVVPVNKSSIQRVHQSYSRPTLWWTFSSIQRLAAIVTVGQSAEWISLLNKQLTWLEDFVFNQLQPLPASSDLVSLWRSCLQCLQAGCGQMVSNGSGMAALSQVGVHCLALSCGAVSTPLLSHPCSTGGILSGSDWIGNELCIIELSKKDVGFQPDAHSKVSTVSRKV